MGVGPIPQVEGPSRTEAALVVPVAPRLHARPLPVPRHLVPTSLELHAPVEVVADVEATASGLDPTALAVEVVLERTVVTSPVRNGPEVQGRIAAVVGVVVAAEGVADRPTDGQVHVEGPGPDVLAATAIAAADAERAQAAVLLPSATVLPSTSKRLLRLAPSPL